MRVRTMLAGAALLFLGFLAGNGVRALGAQADAGSDWEVYAAPYNNPKNNDNRFFAIKFNRVTGEALVLAVKSEADDEAWLRLPVTDMGGGD